MRTCPVNGPTVAASGTDVVAAWYTAAGGTPQVRLARSADAGDRFDLPLIVDEGEAVQGRVDVALTAGAAWVLWLREEAGGDRKSTRLNSSHVKISYAVFCLKKKKPEH